MAFGVAVTAALSGASPFQLAHWRRRPARGGRPVLVPRSPLNARCCTRSVM